MKKISKYIFSLLLLISYSTYAQDTTNIKVQDSIKKFEINSVSIFYDLSNLAMRFYDPEINSFAVSADLKFNQRFFFSFETGIQNYDIEKTYYNYQLDGWYSKIGIGQEIIKTPDSDTSSSVYMSLRLCYGQANQDVSDIKYVNSYWGETTEDIGKESLNKFWLEFGGGIKAELLRNLYVGWAFYLRISFKKINNESLQPKVYPGFGKGYNNLNAAFHYYVSYNLNFKRKRVYP